MDLKAIYEEMRKRIDIEKRLHLNSMEQLSNFAPAYDLKDSIQHRQSSEAKIEDWVQFNLSKLNELNTLATKPIEIQARFIEYKFFCEKRTKIEKNKIQRILTAACILNRFDSVILGMTDSDLWYLSDELTDFAPESYADNEEIRKILDSFLFDTSNGEKTM